MKMISIKGCQFAYEVMGIGSPTIVLETGVGAESSESDPVAAGIATSNTVFRFRRDPLDHDCASWNYPDAIASPKPSSRLPGDAERFRIGRALTTEDFSMADGQHDDPSVFRARFLRSLQLLHLIASRVLDDPERADRAVTNCWLKASRNPPRFEYESEFRGWLLRVLITEALAILHRYHGSAEGDIALRRNTFGARNQSREDELCC